MSGSDPIPELSDETLFRVGKILHEARMKEQWGSWEHRQPWPKDAKDFRHQRTIQQPWIDVAIAQVRALYREGII